MNLRQRWRIYSAGLVVGLLGLGLWSYGRLAAARDAATQALDDLEACRRLADHVRALSSARPSLAAGTRAWAPTELTGRVERAARDARMAPSCVVRISPGDARKVGDGDYREQPTQLQLRQVTLPQLATFLHALTTSPAAAGEADGDPGNGGSLRVSSLRLSAPRERETGNAGDRWSVEATLTYLIYDPSGNRPTRKGT